MKISEIPCPSTSPLFRLHIISIKKVWGSSKENTTGIKLVIHWRGLCREPENLIPEAVYDTAKCFLGFLQFIGSGLVTFCWKSSAEVYPEVYNGCQIRLKVIFWLLPLLYQQIDFIVLFNETIAVIFNKWTPGNTFPTYQEPGKDKTGWNSQGNLVYVFLVETITTKINIYMILLSFSSWKLA